LVNLYRSVEGLLQRLSDVNGAMSGAVTGGDVRSHTLARHKDIVMEFTHEFRWGSTSGIQFTQMEPPSQTAKQNE
jgi:hypothetical protein